jgi:hypothetical protein
LPAAGRTLAEDASPAVAIACSGNATAFVVEVLERAERLLVPLLMPAPKPMAVRAAASALVFCPTSPSTVPVGRSPWVVLDTLARLRLAQGSILPGLGRTLAEGAGPAVAIACSGNVMAFVVEVLERAERLLVPLLMPAPKPMAVRAAASALVFCPTPPSTVVVGRSPWVVLDTLARLRPAQGPILPGAGRMLAAGAGPAFAIACSGNVMAFVGEVLGRADCLLVPLLLPAPKPMAARAAASALVFCFTPLSMVVVGRSASIALDAPVRPRPAQGSILPAAGRTLAEGASPAVTIACCGIATGSVVEALVPLLLPVPKPMAARAAASALSSVFFPVGNESSSDGAFGSVAVLVFCLRPLSTRLVRPSPWVVPDAHVRLRLAQVSILAGAGWMLAEGASAAVAIACSGIATSSVVDALARAARPPVPAIMLASRPSAGYFAAFPQPSAR